MLPCVTRPGVHMDDPWLGDPMQCQHALCLPVKCAALCTIDFNTCEQNTHAFCS